MSINPLVLLVLSAAILLAGCASAPPPPLEVLGIERGPDYSSMRREAMERAFKVDPDGDGLQFTGPSHYVYLSDFEFDPATLQFQSGTITRVTLNNIAWVTHYFGGEAFFEQGAEIVNVMGSEFPPDIHHIAVEPLSTRDIYLFIKKPGTYPLSCFVPTHRSQGMAGTLVVE